MATMWNSVSAMPADIRAKAKAAGMWEDDIDHIWFVKRGQRKPMTDGKKATVNFTIEGGTVIVQYHS